MKNPRQIRAKILSFMRITLTPFIVVLAFSGMAHALEVKAQEVLAQSVTLEANNVRLHSVLTEIEQQVDVKFVYSSRSVRTERRVSVHANRRRLAELLDEILKPLGLVYKVVGGQIVLNTVASDAVVPPVLFPE